jgi:adenosylhomocysteinase
LKGTISRGGNALPTLTGLARTVARGREVRSLLVTHLLETAVPYVMTVHEIYPVEAVIAIPYSSERSAIDALRRAGLRVIEVPYVAEVGRVALQAVIEALRSSDAPLIVQEVGGYLAAHSRELGQFKHLLGVVEDTNNGHWNYERSSPHRFPVLSIAQSPLKDIEDTLIGDAVAFSLERIFREEFRLFGESRAE